MKSAYIYTITTLNRFELMKVWRLGSCENSGSALGWLQSFLTGRMQYVGVGEARSVTVSCLSGVPQGSVLSPLLFAMYISPVANVVAAHNLHQH